MKSFHLWSFMIVFGWLVAIGPGSIDGRFFPVVSDVKLHAEQDPEDPDWVIVSGTANKLRDNCSPRYMEWFLGSRDGRNAAVEYVWGAPEIRREGAFTFYDWHVKAAPPEVLLNRTFADMLHRCFVHVPVVDIKITYPWLTRTRFWR